MNVRHPTRALVAFLPLLLSMSGVTLAADESLAQRFASPPPRARMLKIIHSWPDQPRSRDVFFRKILV